MMKITLALVAFSMAGQAAAEPKTLLELGGAQRPAIGLQNSVLIIIDAQNEYVTGQIPLPGVSKKIKVIATILKEARKQGTPVIHVVHSGDKGKPFDPAGPGFAIVPELNPQKGETIITKPLPNAFAKTGLQMELERLGLGRNLLLTGFMTHMCVSSTARAALDLGYKVAIATDAVGTRDLRGPNAERIPAETINSSELAALQDRFVWLISSRNLLSMTGSAQ